MECNHKRLTHSGSAFCDAAGSQTLSIAHLFAISDGGLSHRGRRVFIRRKYHCVLTLCQGCVVQACFRHTDGLNRINIGKISSLPASIHRDNTILESTLY